MSTAAALRRVLDEIEHGGKAYRNWLEEIEPNAAKRNPVAVGHLPMIEHYRNRLAAQQLAYRLVLALSKAPTADLESLIGTSWMEAAHAARTRA